MPEALRKQTSNGWEKRRAEFEEVNDSDSLKCNSSFEIGRRGGEEGGMGGRGRKKRRRRRREDRAF